MTDDLEGRLRETLDRRAADARPSDAGWTAINERLDGGRRLPVWLVPSLALGAAAVVVSATVAIMGSGDDPSDVQVAVPAPETSVARGGAETGQPAEVAVFPGIWPETEWDAYAVAAARVAAGADAWRLEPVATATEFLRQHGFPAPVDATWEVLPEDPMCGHVRYAMAGADDAEGHFVELCRPGGGSERPTASKRRPDATSEPTISEAVEPTGPTGSTAALGQRDDEAFVVTAAWSDRFTYRRPIYESPLEFPVGIAVPGTLTARAGVFFSEWIDAVEIPITADEIAGPGYQVPVRLDLGSRVPDSVLVHVIHAPLAGPMAFTAFRLDRAVDGPEAYASDETSGDRPSRRGSDAARR